MIGLDNGGRLNDWDLCRGVGADRSLEGPRTVRRRPRASTCAELDLQGTWQFISTRLLECPGSKHTLTDDLESHFFVLMWVALHWVKHDKAGEIDMKFIFDQQRPLSHGIVDGGVGKSEMYKTKQKELHGIQFACKPFNKLFWRLWGLFSDYNKQRWAASEEREGDTDADVDSDEDPSSGAESAPTRPEPSVLPEKMLRLFEVALKRPGWIDDKVADQFPRAGGVATSRMALPKMDSVDNRADANPAKRRWISKSLGHDLEPEMSAKRAKLE